jgi:ankyrin repeat protein
MKLKPSLVNPLASISVTCVLFAAGCGKATYDSISDASSAGALEEVERHLDSGANVNEKDRKGGTPLHKAAARGRTDVAVYLVEHEADVNMQDNLGDTPLSRAAKNGHTETCEALIGKGADPNLRNILRETPLHMAVGGDKIETVELLLSKGADPNMDSQIGGSCFDIARDKGYQEILDLLEKHTAPK